jgi:hypothetical protein
MSVVVNLLGAVDEILGKGDITSYDDDDMVSITLQKPVENRNIIFGLAYRVNTKNEVVITGVVPDSVADVFNANCEIEKTICAGDKIWSANKKTAAKEIVDTIKDIKDQPLDLTLIKAGPRWHINGITSDSMEKIFRAKDKGLAFELTEADKMPEQGDEPNMNILQHLLVLFCIGAPNCFVMFFFSDVGFAFKVYKVFAPDKTLMGILVGNWIIFMACVIGVALYTADWTTWKVKLQKYGAAAAVLYLMLSGWFFKMKYYPQVPLVVSLMHMPAFIGILRVTALKGVRRASFYKSITFSLFFSGFFCLIIWLLWMIPGDDGSQGWRGSHVWNENTRRALVDDAEPLYKEYEVSVGGAERRTFYYMDCDKSTKTKKVCTNQHCLAQFPGFGLQNALLSSEVGLYCCDPAHNDQTAAAMLNCTRSYSAPCPGNSKVDIYKVPQAPSTMCCTARDKTNEEKEELSDSCAKVKTVWFLVWITPFVCFGINGLLGAFCFVNGVYLNVTDASKLEKTLKQFICLVMTLLLTMWIGISIAGASMRLAGTLLAFCAAGLAVLFAWVYLEVGAKAITVGVRGSRLMQGLISMATNDWVRAILIICLNVTIPLALAVNMMNQTVRRMRGVSRSPFRFTEGMLYVMANLKHWNWASILIKMSWLNLLYWTLSIGVAKLTSVFLAWLNQQLLEIPFGAVCAIFFVIGFTMFMLPPVPGIPVYMTAGIILAKRGGRSDAGVGFWGGTLIAIALSFFLETLRMHWTVHDRFFHVEVYQDPAACRCRQGVY